MRTATLILITILTGASWASLHRADADNDGIMDAMDKCPRTKGNSDVNSYGCTKGEKVVMSLDVQFATDSSVLGQEYRSQIQSLAEFLRTHPGTKVEIKGFADSRGSASRNKRLSMERAQTVRQVLLSDFRVDPARVKAVGYGETHAVTDNRKIEGRYRNRRVEARILDSALE